MGRPSNLIPCLLLAILALAQPSLAQEPVPSRIVASEFREGVQVKLLEGPFGRMLDLNLSAEAPEDIDLQFLVAERNITDAVELSPPFVETVYAFTGLEPAAVCRMKLQLDTFLALSGQPNLAYSDQPNELCGDLGVKAPLSAWREDFALAAGYRRLLVLHISGQADAPFPYTGEPVVWAHLELPAGFFADGGRLLEEVTAFTEANRGGVWALARPEIAPLAQGLRVDVISDGTAILSIGTGVAEASGWLERIQAVWSGRASVLVYALLAAVSLGLLLALWWGLRRRRKAKDALDQGKPLRAITVGYGPDKDYSLGEGEARDVALVAVYDNGRMRVIRKAPGERITVNGKDVGEGAWITGSDKVAIGPKQFQFR